MKPSMLLRRLVGGAFHNVPFSDLLRLVEAFGFHFSRIRGSHHYYSRTGVQEILNFQDVNGEAKPYQIKQFLRLVEKYNLKMEDQVDE